MPIFATIRSSMCWRTAPSSGSRRARAPADLRDNPVFDGLGDGVVERAEARRGEPVETAGLTLELVPVPGKAPLYREGADPAIGSEAGEATAVIARAGRTALAYVP